MSMSSKDFNSSSVKAPSPPKDGKLADDLWFGLAIFGLNIKIAPTSLLPTTSAILGSPIKPVMSLTKSTPASIAASATSAFHVSIDRGTSVIVFNSFITGTTLLISSSIST